MRCNLPLRSPPRSFTDRGWGWQAQTLWILNPKKRQWLWKLSGRGQVTAPRGRPRGGRVTGSVQTVIRREALGMQNTGCAMDGLGTFDSLTRARVHVFRAVRSG